MKVIIILRKEELDYMKRENTVNSILTALVKKKNKPPVRHGYNEG